VENRDTRCYISFAIISTRKSFKWKLGAQGVTSFWSFISVLRVLIRTHEKMYPSTIHGSERKYHSKKVH
jgi:hypothetical protein